MSAYFFQAPTPPAKRARQRRARDRTDIASGNMVDTEPGRDRRPRQIFSPEVQNRRRR